MRILFVTNMYPERSDSYYGIFVKEFEDSLQALGFEITVFFTDAREQATRYLSDILRLRRLLKQRTFDVVHAHHSYSVLQVLAARIQTRSAHVPLVLTLHEGEIFAPREHRPTRRVLLKRIGGDVRFKRLACTRVDYLVGVESRLLEAMRPTMPACVIPPGVDTTLFRPMDPVRCRRELGIGLASKVVFFPASPTTAKGYDLFEASLDHLESAPEIVVGGEIARHKMPLYMNASDVVVTPSRFEASPMAVKEAMAVNVPLVSTDVGDARSLLGGLAGCYIASPSSRELARAMTLALNGPPRSEGRRRIIDRGLTLESVAQRYAGIYREIVPER